MIGFLLMLAATGLQQAPIHPDATVEPVINTGAGLLENCSTDQTASSQAERDFHLGLCLGFIKGVTNTLAEQELGEICPPDDLTNEKLKEVVVTWLNSNPQFLDAPAVGAVVAATTQAFACESQPNDDSGSNDA